MKRLGCHVVNHIPKIKRHVLDFDHSYWFQKNNFLLNCRKKICCKRVVYLSDVMYCFHWIWQCNEGFQQKSLLQRWETTSGQAVRVLHVFITYIPRYHSSEMPPKFGIILSLIIVFGAISKIYFAWTWCTASDNNDNALDSLNSSKVKIFTASYDMNDFQKKRPFNFSLKRFLHFLKSYGVIR